MLKPLLLLAMPLVLATFTACKDDDTPTAAEPALVFKFVFDETAPRQGNAGTPVAVPPGNAAQHPSFNGMAAHYVEMVPDQWTQLGEGAVVFKSPETSAGGDMAIDFSQLTVAGPGETFLRVPLASVQPGTYTWLRISIAYQNFSVEVTEPNVPGIGELTVPATVASFLGYNNYIGNYTIANESVTVNDDKLQGYFGVEAPYAGVITGDAPATTVPNPLSATSPIPAGSCLVTGAFAGSGLTLTGQETEDIVVTVRVSINNSFEWVDGNANGKYEPSLGEQVVDMGTRGIQAVVN